MASTIPPVIRQATVADIDPLAVLFDAYRQFYDQAPDLPLARRFVSDRMTHAQSVVLVSQAADGALTGFCQLYPSFCSVMAAPIYVLYDLFVTPACRRQHLGKRLLSAAANRGRCDGMARMDLTTAHTNSQAQWLYESMGWKQDRVFRTYNLDLASST
jgi:ribosomal protein S18 acetylase RimI-like enzyme